MLAALRLRRLVIRGVKIKEGGQSQERKERKKIKGRKTKFDGKVSNKLP